MILLLSPKLLFYYYVKALYKHTTTELSENDLPLKLLKLAKVAQTYSCTIVDDEMPYILFMLLPCVASDYYAVSLHTLVIYILCSFS